MKPDTRYPQTGPSLSDRLKSAALYPLPHHGISRIVHAATRWQAPWFKNRMIHWFARRYRVDLAEAAEPSPEGYRSFNEFFTRSLRPGARPMPADPHAVVSPADGTVSAIGRIDEDTLVQAKGRRYTVTELLGGDATVSRRFRGGHYVTIYLSPRDYHRVHTPVACRLREMVHIPGRLFSVAPFTVRTVPRLFARNERVAALFDSLRGPMAMVLVGAINVASIQTVWASEVTPPRGRRVRRWQYEGGQARTFERGEEMGRFNMGSTVILLFGPKQLEWLQTWGPEQKIRLGQPLGRYHTIENEKVVHLDDYLKSAQRGRP